jgi:hypothetical protein
LALPKRKQTLNFHWLNEHGDTYLDVRRLSHSLSLWACRWAINHRIEDAPLADQMAHAVNQEH